MKSDHLPAISKKDFYLRFLLLHPGQTFTPETLYAQRAYFLKHHKCYPGTEIIAESLFEEYIPCCDRQTIKDIKKRMNYLVNLISACMENQNQEKLKSAQDELDQLSDYLKKSCSQKGKICYFSSAQDRLRIAVLKAIYRSIINLKKSRPDLALSIKNQLQYKPAIGIRVAG